MGSLRRSYFYLATLLCSVRYVYGALPWESEIVQPSLKASNEVSFDPLSLLAILWNPRAAASASRLYMQPDLATFRWPHMLQIGGALAPVSAFVSHLTSNYASVHPAVDMCTGTMTYLDVRSSIGGGIKGSTSLFSRLLSSSSNSPLQDVLNFKPSDIPSNDILIVAVQAGMESFPNQRPWKVFAAKSTILCSEIVMGLIVIAGTVFGSLLGDLWAVVLFATYAFHWLASTAISFFPLITIDNSISIRSNASIVYAVLERPAGGKVIFKGRQDDLERWARMKWVFSATTYHKSLHWAWILTGSTAALASVACMVNMDGRLQLAFLGMLLYASAAELWITVLAQKLQTIPVGSLNFHSAQLVRRNTKWYKSIVQATLGVDARHRLEKLRWIDLALLPPLPVFEAMVEIMDFLNHTSGQCDMAEVHELFLKGCEARNAQAEDVSLRDAIWVEIEAVYLQRQK